MVPPRRPVSQLWVGSMALAQLSLWLGLYAPLKTLVPLLAAQIAQGSLNSGSSKEALLAAVTLAGSLVAVVATPLAGSSMIHDMSMDGGVMKMAEMTGGLPLVANQAVTLAPGGKHIMLMGLTGPLVEGVTVPLTLTFEATPAMTVQAVVRQPKP